MIPFIRWKNQTPRLAVTGCSLALITLSTSPSSILNVVTHCVAMSGADMTSTSFWTGTTTTTVYFNNPPDFLPNMHDYCHQR